MYGLKRKRHIDLVMNRFLVVAIPIHLHSGYIYHLLYWSIHMQGHMEEMVMPTPTESRRKEIADFVMATITFSKLLEGDRWGAYQESDTTM